MNFRIPNRHLIYLLVILLSMGQSGSFIEILFAQEIEYKSDPSNGADSNDATAETGGEEIPEGPLEDENESIKHRTSTFLVVLIHQSNYTKQKASFYRGICDWGLSPSIDTPPPKMS